MPMLSTAPNIAVTIPPVVERNDGFSFDGVELLFGIATVVISELSGVASDELSFSVALLLVSGFMICS